MVVALLLIALACLVVGLILTSSVWLVASLLATAVAAGALVMLRSQRSALDPGRGHGAHEAPDEPDERAAANVLDLDPDPDRDPARDPARDTDLDADRDSDPGPRGSAEPVVGRPTPGEVWVIDGRPRFHRRGCEVLDGHDPQTLETIPRAQAVEDGFLRCSLCSP